MDPLTAIADGARTALGFFWKSGWAFVLGYFISAMIQAFVPNARLTRHMGDSGAGSHPTSASPGPAASVRRRIWPGRSELP